MDLFKTSLHRGLGLFGFGLTMISLHAIWASWWLS